MFVTYTDISKGFKFYSCNILLFVSSAYSYTQTFIVLFKCILRSPYDTPTLQQFYIYLQLVLLRNQKEIHGNQYVFISCLLRKCINLILGIDYKNVGVSKRKQFYRLFSVFLCFFLGNKKLIFAIFQILSIQTIRMSYQMNNPCNAVHLVHLHYARHLLEQDLPLQIISKYTLIVMKRYRLKFERVKQYLATSFVGCTTCLTVSLIYRII